MKIGCDAYFHSLERAVPILKIQLITNPDNITPFSRHFWFCFLYFCFPTDGGGRLVDWDYLTTRRSLNNNKGMGQGCQHHLLFHIHLYT